MNQEIGTEREIKLALGHDVALPGLGDLAEGVSVVDQGTVQLHARYFDTADFALSRLHIAVRHRRDHSWTYKGPSHVEDAALVREEREWPGSAVMPDELRGRVVAAIGDRELIPVAWLLSRRHRLDIVDKQGLRLLEIDDDDVSVFDANQAEVDRFREVEVELVGPAEASLVTTVVARFIAIGATRHVTAKYARALRALGYQPNPGAPS